MYLCSQSDWSDPFAGTQSIQGHTPHLSWGPQSSPSPALLLSITPPLLQRNPVLSLRLWQSAPRSVPQLGLLAQLLMITSLLNGSSDPPCPHTLEYLKLQLTKTRLHIYPRNCSSFSSSVLVVNVWHHLTTLSRNVGVLHSPTADQSPSPVNPPFCFLVQFV